MFSFFKDKPEIRTLEKPQELQIGDIVSFKDLPPIPPDMQGQDFEVTKITGCEYRSGFTTDFIIKSAEGLVVALSIESDNGDDQLVLSRVINRKIVLSLFGEDNFSQLWDDEHIELITQAELPELAGWYTESYQQQVCEQEGFFYEQDTRKDVNADDGLEFRYHECLSSDEQFGLTVEVYEDGDTEVSLQVYTPISMIQDMWFKGTSE